MARYSKTLFFVCSLSLLSALNVGASSYNEKYRPQYHFTAASRWIGDPCGLYKFNDKYRAYSWGAAESPDLVHWKEINRQAVTGVPDNISCFTGSVVIDRDNTAGWGENVPVAVFTSFDKESKKQSQSVAFSHDNGETFQYYDLNPVLDIWSTEFRDPTVIRYNDRWIMAVAKALEKKVGFYESDDLKHWTWLSDFGPMGDNEKSWECPDLFQLTVEETGEKKWVLLVSVNWAREQYFVGDFDGRQFIPDQPYALPNYVDDGLDYYASRVFQDFDSTDSEVYSLGWVNTWDYAPAAPTQWCGGAEVIVEDVEHNKEKKEKGKGIWSLPRQLSLCQTPDGLRMRQQPAASLKTLRGKLIDINRVYKPGTTELESLSELGNCYEMQVKLRAAVDDVVGFDLCQGDGRKVTLSYDTASGYLTLDRTNSTDADIPKFDRISYVRLHDRGTREVTLHIFVDKSTIEVFADNGRKVLTLLTYAAPGQNGVSIFSRCGTVRASIQVWPIASIWK